MQVFHCKSCIGWKMLEDVHNEHTMGCTMGYMGMHTSESCEP